MVSSREVGRSVVRWFVLSLGVLASILLPGEVRAVPSDIVISEFRVRGPNGGNDEFVELYNRAGGPINISGWKIRGSNAAGTVSTRATINPGVSIPSGCHYLLTNSAAGGYSGLVPGDQTYTTGITDDGGVAVTLPDDTPVDQVGMSVGSAFREGTPLPVLGTNENRSYERRPGGALGSGMDTDNNSVDFRLIMPSDPQNAASACIGGPTNPSGVGAADPEAVNPGDSSLLTVAVTPGTNPPSTGITVTGNLSLIGESAAQPFFDDGTHGDVTPDDNTFSYFATVAIGTTPGTKMLPTVIADEQMRTGNATIRLFVQPPLLPIHEIQGPGTVSPYADDPVTTQGIVTARRSNGFYIQMPDALIDDDPNTSEGLFVFTSTAPPAQAAVRNLVTVAGILREFVPAADPPSPPLTEIVSPSVFLVSPGHALPARTTLMPSDTDPAGPIEQLERFEGMRVHVPSLTVVSPTMGFVDEPNATATSNGVFYGVITTIHRPFREPGVRVLDPLPPGSPCCVPRWDFNPERLRVDSDAQPGAPALEVTSGTVLDLTGPLDFAFRTYTILPDPPNAPPPEPGSAVPVPVPARDEFTIGSFNMEHFYDTFDDPGGDVRLSDEAFEKRLGKASLAIRNVMQTPDILGVQEVENITTLRTVAQRVNDDAVAAGQPNPNYQAYLVEGIDIGLIDVGFLVKAARVSVLEVTQFGRDATYINPDTGLPAPLNDRPPLLLRAEVRSAHGLTARVTVVVVHQRSFINIADAVAGNRVRHKRRAQAEYLANLIQSRQAADPHEKIVVVGDFNAYQFNDGYVDAIGASRGAPTPADMVVLPSGDLVDPDLFPGVDLAVPTERYSYTFDGSAQAIDHGLISKNLGRQFRGFHYARNGADFPETFRNFADRPERVSDHDMPVAYFRFLPRIGGTSPAKVWLGLRNSDDQGTQFDLRAALYVNNRLVTEGQTLCVTGITRNPSRAREVEVPFGAISEDELAPGDVLSVKFSTRVGTNPDGSRCPGHSNAVGLRLYYDATHRPSLFGAAIEPDPLTDYFLRLSNSGLFLDMAAPTSAQAREKDSGGVNFAHGNPWAEIGTWSRVP